MTYLAKIKSLVSARRNVGAGIAVIAVVAAGLLLVPQKANINTLAENCQNPPVTPTLNFWPVTYADTNIPLCHDFPAIDAAIDVANPVFSQSEADWNDGLTLNPGQDGVALVYVHNGAANNLDPNTTVARNVRIITETDTTTGTAHTIRTTFVGDNTNTVRSSFTIHTPADSHLEVYPNSGFMFTYDGRLIADQQNLNLGNSTFTLGDLDACFEYSVFLSFKFKVVRNVVTPVNPTLSIDKQVRNVTKNTIFADSTTAVQNDQVQYQVKVKNNGPTTATAVTLADNGVAGISLDGSVLNSTGSPISGIFPGTVNLGDMQSGEERTFTYTGRVTTTSGTLVNTATADASNTPAVPDTASVIVQAIPQPGRLAINKLVKNDTLGGNFVDTTEARTGDRVTFQVVVTNTGSSTVNNVRLVDTLPSGLNLETGTIRVDGLSISSIDASLGSLTPGQSKTMTFTAQVVAVGPVTLRNVATASGDSVASVTDDAFVSVVVIPKPGQPNIVLSKRAFNDTKNVDATTVPADREDFITYSLITTNQGTADAVNYVISDDLSQVLPFADMVELNGGTLSGNTITYPAVTIRPGETIVKTFKVRVKASLQANLAFQMRNTYGNTIVINIPGKTVFKAPPTGAAGTSAAVFSGLITAGFLVFRKRDALLKFILN